MFIKLWNFLRGYVKIHILGFAAERLINRANAEGIIFWDVGRVQVAISVKVSYRDYKRLCGIADKTGSTLKVVGFAGLPTIVARLRKRGALMAGCLLFVAGLVALTSFIWRIDIVGTDRLDADEMIEFLAENGFEVGTFRHGIAYRDVESLLMARFSDIAWVSLSIRGTAAEIRLVETIPQPEIVDLSTPTDIVAAKDGLIVQMATSLGVPQFVPGDVVRAGEVLVSGQLTIGVEGEEITYEYIRAQSEIWARLYYRINFDIPLVFYEKTFTGRTRSVYSIMIVGNEFTLPHRRHNFIYYDTVVGRGQLSFGADYPLPMGYAVTERHEMVRHLQRRTVYEAVALGEEMVMARIEEELPGNAHIITKEVRFTENEHYITMEIFMITIERIDREQEIRE
ncbi:MAG: sporulation protein YqfD [Defluviitaleaceae bacterium]|nr:sporulation protein YqfD [Defluviitaleaceae bacterium]